MPGSSPTEGRLSLTLPFPSSPFVLALQLPRYPDHLRPRVSRPTLLPLPTICAFSRCMADGRARSSQGASPRACRSRWVPLRSGPPLPCPLRLPVLLRAADRRSRPWVHLMDHRHRLRLLFIGSIARALLVSLTMADPLSSSSRSPRCHRVTYKMKSGPAPIKADPVKKVAGSECVPVCLINLIRVASGL